MKIHYSSTSTHDTIVLGCKYSKHNKNSMETAG